jgi:hypothetical protein
MLDIENISMGIAIEALGKNIARWADKSAVIATAIQGLLPYRRSTS